MTKRTVFIVVALVAVGIAAGLFLSSDRYQQWLAEKEKQSLPPAENINFNSSPTNSNTESNINETEVNTNTAPLPAAKNFIVPFTSQAPDANWDQDHDEFCEEASVLMVGRFWRQLTISGAADAEQALQDIKAWELEHFGFYYDTTAAETAQILDGLYPVKTRLIEDPTIDQIKTEVAAGHPVIVPTAGRELNNPNFRTPGPLYHMVVIKGYTADGKFITNDAGTRRGADYVYDQSVIMSAMHDWIPGSDRTKPGNGTTTNGRKVVIVTTLK